MKRITIITFEIIIAYLLQSTIFPVLSIGDIVPNLLIIITVCAGYMKGKVEGLFVGLACGLLTDISYGSLLGLYGMVYMVIGYLNGYVSKFYYKEDFAIPMLLIGASNFMSGFVYYVFEFLLRGKTNVIFYIRRIIVPELVYTVAVSIILYKLINHVNVYFDRKKPKEV